MRTMTMAAVALSTTLFIAGTAKADSEGFLGSGNRTDNPTFGGGVGDVAPTFGSGGGLADNGTFGGGAGLTEDGGQLGSGNRTLVYLAPGIGAGVGEVGENGILGSGTIILVNEDGSIVVAY
jgi:hypothetical protein